jgi:hypothetical protein
VRSVASGSLSTISPLPSLTVRFGGSAGQAVISQSQALLFVDSRYWVQAGRQVDPAVWTVVRVGDNGKKTWIDWAAEVGAQSTDFDS